MSGLASRGRRGQARRPTPAARTRTPWTWRRSWFEKLVRSRDAEISPRRDGFNPAFEMTLRFGTAAQTFLDAAERDGDVDVCPASASARSIWPLPSWSRPSRSATSPAGSKRIGVRRKARARTSLPAQPRLLCSREALSGEAELGYQCSTDTSRPIARAGLIRQAGTLAGLPGRTHLAVAGSNETHRSNALSAFACFPARA